MYDFSEGPRYIIWELTKTNNQQSLLNPVHPGKAKADMTTTQAVKFIDSVANAYRTTIIITGGEPLTRPDVFDLAEYARAKGLGIILNTNGSLFDTSAARRCVEGKLRGVQISLDGSSSRTHDGFRQVPGAFTQAIKAIELVKLAGIKFEIFTFVTKDNMEEIPKINTLAQKLGAWGHTFVFNIPTGPFEHLTDLAVPDEDYQKWLNWIFEQKYRLRINLKPICTPQFKRILQQRGNELPDSINPLKSVHAMEDLGPGCPGAKTICFVANNGDVYPCSYTGHQAGNVLKRSFKHIWTKSPIFQDFRSPSKLQEKCGRCEYNETCGGCRALAEKASGNHLGEDPSCPYEPKGKKKRKSRKR